MSALPVEYRSEPWRGGYRGVAMRGAEILHEAAKFKRRRLALAALRRWAIAHGYIGGKRHVQKIPARGQAVS